MVGWFGLNSFWYKSIIVFIVLLIICGSFVSATPPYKEHPGKGKKNPPIVETIDNGSIVWVSNVFNGFVFVVSDEDDLWGEWSYWWSLWNILSDVPMISDGSSVDVNVKYRINKGRM